MWEGVSLDTLLNGIADDASFALVRAFGGYTTNLPLEDLLDGQAWVAFNLDGEDLAPEHGGPARARAEHEESNRPTAPASPPSHTDQAVTHSSMLRAVQ
jgi:DMSO/TMAO reductase YedYZ molybdopterin-dependent catalytic subunit